MKEEALQNENVPANTPEGTDVPQDGKSAGKEIQEQRAMIRKLEEEKKALESKTVLTPEQIAQMISEGVNKVLESKNKESREHNYNSALERFKREQEGFDIDSDPDGEKFELVKKELENFKLDGLSSEEDFISAISKANLLVTGVTPTKEPSSTPSYVQTPGTSTQSKTSGETTSVRFSPEEKEIFKLVGMSIEEATQLKTKNPEQYFQIMEA